MKQHLRTLTAVLLLAPALSIAIDGQSAAEGIFREGLMLERAEGKLRDAIFRYERVVAEFPSSREVVARALHQLALAYETVRDPRAKLMWSRLAADASNPYAAEARTKLAALQATAAAGPFRTRALDASYEFGSPDGKFVVYYKERQVPTRLHLRDLATGAERVLVDGDALISNFSWSPDSRQLAFNANKSGQNINDVRIVTIATGDVRSLGVRGYPRGWTEQGDLFIYRPNYAESSVDWFLLPAIGGEPRKVFAENPNEGCCTAITPDGAALIVARSKRLAVHDIATGDERPLTLGSGEETRPIVSPDSRLVAFASNQDGKWAIYVASLRGLPAANPLRLGAIDEIGMSRGGGAQWWTRDGLLTLRLSYSDSNVYRIEMDPKSGHATSAPQRLTQDAPENFQPAVSPDGRHVAYFYRNGLRGGIAVMDAGGLNERPLVEQAGVLPIAWRSGDEILFHDFAAGAGTRAPIMMINIKTGAMQEVARVEGLYWSYVAARKEILHLYPGGGGGRPGAALKAYSLADGKDRLVATIDFLVPWLAVSADGRHIAYGVTSGGSSEGGSGEAGCELSLMSIEGVREKVLIPLQRSCAVAASWSPDGKYLLLSTEQGPSIMNVETNESWPLHKDLVDQPGWDRGSWAPDGSFVALGRSTRRVERAAWEGVTYDAVTRLLAASGVRH